MSNVPSMPPAAVRMLKDWPATGSKPLMRDDVEVAAERDGAGNGE